MNYLKTYVIEIINIVLIIFKKHQRSWPIIICYAQDLSIDRRKFVDLGLRLTAAGSLLLCAQFCVSPVSVGDQAALDAATIDVFERVRLLCLLEMIGLVAELAEV